MYISVFMTESINTYPMYMFLGEKMESNHPTPSEEGYIVCRRCNYTAYTQADKLNFGEHECLNEQSIEEEERDYTGL